MLTHWQADGDHEQCWICLDDAAEDGSRQMISPCKCPRKVHPQCLARWQLQQAGRHEEKFCRWANLPAWILDTWIGLVNWAAVRVCSGHVQSGSQCGCRTSTNASLTCARSPFMPKCTMHSHSPSLDAYLCTIWCLSSLKCAKQPSPNQNAHKHKHTSTHAHTHAHTHTQTHTHARVHILAHICTRAQTYTHTHTRARARMH
jgi:hypothetical protein